MQFKMETELIDKLFARASRGSEFVVECNKLPSSVSQIAGRTQVLVFRNCEAFLSSSTRLQWLDTCKAAQDQVTVSCYPRLSFKKPLGLAISELCTSLKESNGLEGGTLFDVPDVEHSFDTKIRINSQERASLCLLANFGQTLSRFHREEDFRPTMETLLKDDADFVVAKLWMFVMPGPGVRGQGIKGALALSGPLFHYVQRFLQFDEDHTFVVVLRAGDTIFVPAGMTHAVLTVWPKDCPADRQIARLLGVMVCSQAKFVRAQATKCANRETVHNVSIEVTCCKSDAKSSAIGKSDES